MNKATLIASAVFSASLASSVAQAASITIGTVNGSGMSVFNNAGDNNRYQQVYGAAAFTALSGPVEITSLSFFAPDQVCTPWSCWDNTKSIADGEYLIRLSTTSSGVDGLAANFNSNWGADVQTFFEGSLSNTLTITGSNSFSYDPSMGNLLLDVLVLEQTSNGGDLSLHRDNYTRFNSTTNRVRDHMSNRLGSGATAITTGVSWTRTSGYITEFSYEEVTPVPLPGALVLMLSGLGMLGAVGLKRKPAPASV